MPRKTTKKKTKKTPSKRAAKKNISVTKKATKKVKQPSKKNQRKTLQKKTSNNQIHKKAVKRKQNTSKTSKKTSKKKRESDLVKELKALPKKQIKKLHPGHHPMESMFIAIIILSILGLSVAGYLIYMHFKPLAASICTINNKLDCDVVNKSVYARFMGVPNSMIGALGYLFFILLSTLIVKGYNLSNIHYKLRARHLIILTFLFALIGEGFSLYLLYIEMFVLHTYCIFCLASLAVMTAIFILSWIILKYCNRCKDIIYRIHYKARGKMCRYC